MKKKLLLTFVGTYLASLGLMVAGDDLVKGYDFTGSSSVTAAKLNQLVDNATPGTNRGLVYYSPSAPSASYYRYLWLDPSTTVPGLKVYSTNGGGWSNIVASVSFSQNSIAAGVLQQNAVSTTNIVDSGISSIKIAAGAVTSSKLGLQAVDATNIVNNTITSTQVATNGLATANYADASVTAAKLAAGSVGTSNLQSGFTLYGTNIASGTITSANIATSGVALTNIDMTAGSANQVLRVNPSGTALQWALDPYVFVSTNMVITAGSSIVVTNYAHGLGSVPDAVIVSMVCRGASVSHGYATNAKVPAWLFSNFTGQPSSVSVMADASNIHVSRLISTSSHVANFSTLALTLMTEAQMASDWYVQVTCIKYNR